MLILGHRGANDKTTGFSQNSLPAFLAALQHADGFETDACLSKDGRVFLIHDSDCGHGIGDYLDTSSAAKAGKYSIDQLSADAIRQLCLIHGEAIPTLQQAIDLVAAQSGKLLNIELKNHGVVDAVLEILQENFRNHLKPDAILISSFDHAALKIVRNKMPQVKIGALCVTENEGGMKIFPSHPDSAATYVSLTAENLQSPLLQDMQPDVFVMPEKLLTGVTLAMIDVSYPKAHVSGWTVSENDDYDQAELIARLKQLPQHKIAAMIVDNPAAFVEAWRNG